MFQLGLRGVLGRKLRVVTLNSHLNLLPAFDRILVLEDGRVAFDGTFAQLAIAKSVYAAVAAKNAAESDVEVASSLNDPEAAAAAAAAAAKGSSVAARRLDAAASMKAARATAHATASAMSGELARVETKATGSVAFENYARYVGAGVGAAGGAGGASGAAGSGALGAASLLLAFMLAQGARVVADAAGARWALVRGGDSAWSREATVYLTAVGLTLCTLMLRTGLLNIVAARSSSRLHSIVLAAVLGASVPHFFDTHTMGAVLNRFGKDVETLDVMIPEFLQQVLMNSLMVVSIFALCVASTPYFALPLLGMGLLFRRLFTAFRATSRDLKRLEALTRYRTQRPLPTALCPN